MRSTIAGAAALGLAACASGPAYEGPSGNLNVDLDGNGRWSIDCRAEAARGRTARARQQARGSRDFGKVFLDDVVTARCEYDAGDASLRVQVTDEGLSCPFGSHEEECVGVFEANASGSFELTAR